MNLRCFTGCMRITGLNWLGVRTDEYSDTVDFFTTILGLDVLDVDARGFTILSLPDKSTVEVFGPESQFNQHLQTPAPGFFVTDIDSADAELRRAGTEIVLPIQRGGPRSWLHFRAPDGFVYGLTQAE